MERDFEPLGGFPVNALSPIAGRFVRAMASHYGTDPSLHGTAALATVAAAIGKRWSCIGAVRDEITHANLYVLIAACTGYGKSAQNRVTRPIIQASEEMESHWRQFIRPRLRVDLRLHERALKKLLNAVDLSLPTLLDQGGVKHWVLHCLRNPGVPLVTRHDPIATQQQIEDIEEQLKAAPTYWIGNTTAAALVDNAARNDGTLFSFSSDAGDLVRIALGKYTRDSAADFDFLLKGYSVEPYRETRICRGDRTVEPCITLSWACQHSILHELLLNDEAHQRGFTARMLIVVTPEDHPPNDDDGCSEVISVTEADWCQLIRCILRKRNEPARRIRVSDEAREVFQRFHFEALERGDRANAEARGQLRRWREQAIRIGVGLVVADTVMGEQHEELVMTEAQALRAVDLARWCCRSTLQQICIGRRERRRRQAERLLQLVRQNGGKMRLRDLRDRHGLDTAMVEAIAAEADYGLDIATDNPPRGRPSRVVQMRRV